MTEVQSLLEIPDEEASRENSTEQTNDSCRRRGSRSKNYKWCLRIVLYTIFVLCGQSVATILGRLYFEKGGASKWLATLAQVGGFPILLPCFFILLCKTLKLKENNVTDTDPPSFLKKSTCIYIPLGILVAGNCFLFSVGLQYLPVSTVTLIVSSQLAFNAFFSYFLNSQKFTPFIINSLVLLTVSSVLLVANNNSDKPAGVTKAEYAAGFICTVCGAAAYGLLLASMQFAFRKVLKRSALKVVLDVIVYDSLIASSATMVGLFASGEWKGLKREMEEYALGKISYVMTLVWTAISWQVFSIGTVGLIFEVSSLYSNAVSTVGLPIVPVLAVFIFHDQMNGIKGASMALAICGFISYAYQHYLDHKKSKNENSKTSQLSEHLSPGEVAEN